MKFEVIGKNLWIKNGSETWSTDLSEVDETYRSSAKRKTASADQILAPMPGKVTKIAAVKGSTVKAGDVLVVMEAMKMEYTLKSEIAGTILDVHASTGMQVGLGDLLVKLKPN